MFACYEDCYTLLDGMLRTTYLESVGESETSDTTTSDDDLEIVCHGSEYEFELERCRKENTEIEDVNQRWEDEDGIIGTGHTEVRSMIDSAYLRPD
jgi:hypothetical protein